ncbi:MAG: hypothetical protein IVW57_15515, partial [Ktedonobacterales bacterium]|nr:hypothetical protein [Ktedonobacterales bacterium]
MNVVVCARCGWPNEPTARMCGGCGQPLSALALPPVNHEAVTEPNLRQMPSRGGTVARGTAAPSAGYPYQMPTRRR